MANVFSKRLFTAPSFSGAATLQFIAPMNFVTVVKTISIAWGDVAVSGLDAWVQLGDLTKLCRRTIAFPGSDPAYIGGSVVFYGMWVLNPLDELFTQTASGTADFYASGYELVTP